MSEQRREVWRDWCDLDDDSMYTMGLSVFYEDGSREVYGVGPEDHVDQVMVDISQKELLERYDSAGNLL